VGPLSSSGGRAALALLHPSKALLAKFPRVTLKPSKKLFRAHQSVFGPWWFSPNGGTPEGGRFDLANGHGTCYLADSPAAAVREYLGRAGVAGVINVAELAGRVVSTLSVGKPRSLADTTSARAANHGITKEISTTVDYALTQEWAEAWSRDGLDGVRYVGRFDTSHVSRCYGLFGPAGADPTAAEDSAPAAATDVARKAGIKVVDNPTVVTIIAPAD